MDGPKILTRTLSATSRPDRYGNLWQYHSRSDHHSKVACWGIVFDLLNRCALLRKHIIEAKIAFGINHEMRDFEHDRKKNLDLVLCTPSSTAATRLSTLRTMIANYSIVLDSDEKAKLGKLPELQIAPVGAVVLALEAKACMTAHQRALPRLYDELNSSHLTVHGATDQAISAGFVMVNISERYLSPDLNKANRETSPVWSTHRQPRDASLAIEKARQIPRRSRVGDVGYDALAITLIDCANDGSPVKLFEKPPAPQDGDIYNYASFIHRLSADYSTRFREL